MSGSDRIRVLARVRPLVSRELEAEDEEALALRGDSVVAATSTGRPVAYAFDHVAGAGSSQQQVFDFVKPQVDAALSGFNTTVFAYGQTGTGKTHTMLGMDMWQLAATSPDEAAATLAAMSHYGGEFQDTWGIIPRAMAYIFKKLTVSMSGGGGGGGAAPRNGSPMARSSGSMSANRGASRLPNGVSVSVSYLEIYNERIYDLLDPRSTLARAGAAEPRTPGPGTIRPPSGEESPPGVQGLSIVHDDSVGIVVPEAIQVSVESEDEVLGLLWQGAQHRVLRGTDMNEYSSRSHTIWQVTIERKLARRRSDPPRRRRGDHSADDEGDDEQGDGDGWETVVVRSKLNFVDLAGSEKIRTHHMDPYKGARLAELTSINTSLSSLGNCIRALAQRGRTHVPYRNSKLTRLLQDSLGGNCKTTFIVTLSPALSAQDETVSTLQFAERAAHVSVHAERNEQLDDATQLRRYKAEVAKLRRALQAARAGGSGAAASAVIDSPKRSAVPGAVEGSDAGAAQIESHGRTATPLAAARALMSALQLPRSSTAAEALARRALSAANPSHPGPTAAQEVALAKAVWAVRSDLSRSRSEAVRAREEAEAWRRQCLEARAWAADAEAGRRRLLLAVSKTTEHATGTGGGDGVEASDIDRALAALEEGHRRHDERTIQLDVKEQELQRRGAALRSYFEWLRALPVAPLPPGFPGRAALTDDTEPSSPRSPRKGSPRRSSLSQQAQQQEERRAEAAALRLRERVALLDDALRRAEASAADARASFAADLEALQSKLDQEAARSAEVAQALEEAARAATARGEAASAAAPTAEGNKTEEAEDPTAKDWGKHVDKRTQRSYWHNTVTGETTWRRPVALDSPKAKQQRREWASQVEKFRAQLSRLFAAVSDQLVQQLQEIVRQGVGDGGEAAEEALGQGVQEEVERYQSETLGALDREVSLLAAHLGLR